MYVNRFFGDIVDEVVGDTIRRLWEDLYVDPRRG